MPAASVTACCSEIPVSKTRSGNRCHIGISPAVVTIAADRHMTTTAEGVETEQQRELLRELGCSEMQGYLFSRPIPAAEMTKLLQSGTGLSMVLQA